jgi:hypothetical protein
MAWMKTLTKDNEPPKPPDPENKPDKPAEKSLADVIAESLRPVTEQLTSLRSELDSMKAGPPKPAAASPEMTSVLDDENAAFAQRLTPVLARTYEIEARIARDEVEREYRNLGFGDLWEQNRKDIEDFLNNSALVTQDGSGKVVPLRGDPNFVRNVADMVIGRATRKSGIRYDGKDKRFFLEDATGETNLLAKRPLDGEGLSKKQIEAAKRFGIPVKGYAEAMKKLDFVQ